jgi:hypothetical protein
MVRGGRKIRFRPPKVRFHHPPTESLTNVPVRYVFFLPIKQQPHLPSEHKRAPAKRLQTVLDSLTRSAVKARRRWAYNRVELVKAERPSAIVTKVSPRRRWPGLRPPRRVRAISGWRRRANSPATAPHPLSIYFFRQTLETS